MALLIIMVVMILTTLFAGCYAIATIHSRKSMGITYRKYTKLSEPARRIVESNAELPEEWQIDRLWLYNTLVGIDERLTVKAVNKHHQIGTYGGTEFSWRTGHNMYKSSEGMGQYYELMKNIDGLKDALSKVEADIRHARTEHAAEDMEEILSKLRNDQTLIHETRNQMKKLK